MKRSFRAFLAALLLAVPLLSSCSEVQAPEAPSAANIERQDGLLGDLLGGTIDLVGGTVNGLVNLVGAILTGPDANGAEKSAWIGKEGGKIRTAAYTLVVPRGAVSERTQFVVEPENNGSYTVNLHAYEQGLLGLRDVGGRGFRKPVKLTISYENANGVRDERKLTIIYLSSPNSVEIQPTTIDRKDKEVTAQLSHFSKYAMAQN